VYRKLAANFLNVSADFGRFLYMCARARRARQIVEFGTSFGISRIHLACALRDNAGGYLIGTELEPTKAKRAGENLAAAGLADLVESALAAYSKRSRMVSRKMWTWCCWTVRSASICPCSRYWSLT
jgi:predicted O-methyltransferase YrrM